MTPASHIEVEEHASPAASLSTPTRAKPTLGLHSCILQQRSRLSPQATLSERSEKSTYSSMYSLYDTRKDVRLILAHRLLHYQHGELAKRLQNILARATEVAGPTDHQQPPKRLLVLMYVIIAR